MNWVASIWNLAFLNCDYLAHHSASLTRNSTGRINGIQLWGLLTTWESKTVDGRWSSWWGGHIISCVTWENSRHFTTPPVVFPRTDLWETSAEILYRWRVTTQIWIVLLIGWSKCPTRHVQSEGRDISIISFCACFSDVIPLGNHCWRRERSAVFSVYILRGRRKKRRGRGGKKTKGKRRRERLQNIR